MALKANKAMNFVKGATKAFTKNADDYAQFAGRWKNTAKTTVSTSRVSAPKVGGYAKPKNHVAQAPHPHTSNVNYDFDLSRVQSNKAINPAGKANQAAGKTTAQQTAKSKAKPQTSSAKATNQNAKKQSGGLRGFLKDIDPRGNMSDEYAYLANKRRQTGEEAISNLVSQGRLSTEQGLEASERLKTVTKSYEKRANSGDGNIRSLINDVAKEKSFLYGDGNVNLVAKGAAALEVAEAYFKSGDKSRNMKRIGAAAGAYGATAYGVRKASGGSMMYNRDGRSDIAGVPFF